MNRLTKHRRLILFFVILAINVLVVIKLKVLHISTDEFGVLASAAFFTDNDWSSLVSSIGYYGYGQAVLYIPLFILIKNPIILYVSLLILNSVLISCIPMIIMNILEKYLKVRDVKHIYLITFTVSVYPYYLIYSKWAYYEVLAGLIPWICIYILVKEGANVSNYLQKNLSSVLLGGILVYGYATHGRLIGIIPATLITIVMYQLLTKKKMVNYLYFIPTLIIGLIIDNYIKEYLLLNLWLNTDGSSVNTLDSTLNSMNLFSSNTIVAMFKSFFGQMYYVSSSTFGFIIISIFISISFIVYTIKNKNVKSFEGSKNSIFIVAFFSLVSFFIALTISVIFLAPGIVNAAGRGDYFIYGRYIDNLVGPVIFVGLYLLSVIKIKKRILIISLLFYVIISIYIQFWLSKEILARSNIANLPILDILPYIDNDHIDFISNINFLKLSLIVLSVLVLISIFIRMRKLALICILMSSFFLYTYIYVAKNMIVPNSIRNYAQVDTAIKTFEKLDQLYETYPDIYIVTDNLVKPWSPARYQFMLPQYKVHLYSGEWGLIPDNIDKNSIIMSPYELNLEEKHPDIYRVYIEGVTDTFYDENIWIYGTDIKNYLNDMSIQTLSSTDIFLKKIPLKQFSSQNNKYNHSVNNNTQEMESNGKSGFLMYGPYMSLGEGKYRVSLEVQLIKTIKNELGFVDIVSNGGQSVYNKIVINKQLFDDRDSFNIDLEFSLDEDIRDLEIRLYTNQDVVLRIDSIKISN